MPDRLEMRARWVDAGVCAQPAERRGRMDIEIILASASPRRRELLGQVGLTPIVIPSHVEETITCTEPAQVVMELSAQKAEDVAAAALSRPEDGTLPAGRQTAVQRVVIGADTVVAVDGRILGKPADAAEAVQMLSLLAGRTHQVYTGVTMIFAGSGERVTFAERTDVHVCPMTRAQMEAYAATGDPLDKAGAYGIQGRFAAYVTGIFGDYNNVVGLPVCRVCSELRARGCM